MHAFVLLALRTVQPDASLPTAVCIHAAGGLVPVQLFPGRDLLQRRLLRAHRCADAKQQPIRSSAVPGFTAVNFSLCVRSAPRTQHSLTHNCSTVSVQVVERSIAAHQVDLSKPLRAVFSALELYDMPYSAPCIQATRPCRARAVCLRLQVDPGSTDFKDTSPERAFIDYALCNGLLFLVVWNFMG